MSNSLNCFNCKTQIELLDGPISRGETCSKCGADVKVCYNCKFYDPNSYNECREPTAERVLDKNRRNYCDNFSPSTDPFSSSQKIVSKQDALKKLNDLFKK